MQPTIFLDSAAIEALIRKDHPNFAHAAAFFKAAGVRKYRLITTDLIIAVAVDRIRSRFGADVASEVIRAFRETGLVEIEPIRDEDIQEAWRIYQTIPEDDWTFTMSLTMAIMNRFTTETIFTFDPRYSQYGYKLMPEIPPNPESPPEGIL